MFGNFYYGLVGNLMPCICIRGEGGHDMLRERNVKCILSKLKASSPSCRGGYVNATASHGQKYYIIVKGYRTLPCSVSEQLKNHAEGDQNYFQLA